MAKNFPTLKQRTYISLVGIVSLHFNLTEFYENSFHYTIARDLRSLLVLKDFPFSDLYYEMIENFRMMSKSIWYNAFEKWKDDIIVLDSEMKLVDDILYKVNNHFENLNRKDFLTYLSSISAMSPYLDELNNNSSYQRLKNE